MMAERNSLIGVPTANNLQICREDLGRRRRGASGMAHHFLLLHASTEELVQRDVEKLAVAYPTQIFRLELDGIAGFSVYVNDNLLLQSDFYAVEQDYQQDAKVFYHKLLQRMQQMPFIPE